MFVFVCHVCTFVSDTCMQIPFCASPLAASDADILLIPSPSQSAGPSSSFNTEGNLWIYVGVAIAVFVVAVVIAALIVIILIVKKCKQVRNDEQAEKHSTTYR